MKKAIIIIFCVISLLIFTKGPEIVESVQTYDVIPDEAIRLRILANSDSAEDQQIKHIIRDRVVEQIEHWIGDMTNIDEARTYVENNIPQVQQLVAQVLQDLKVSQQVNVEYSTKVPFPMKLYDSILYPAGDYEAVLITLGEGRGANWWCVLFPPLCFLDFSSGTTVADDVDEAEEEGKKEVKVKFFLFKWLGLS